MSVATEIQRIKTAIANAYTAVSGKGGTVPQSAVVGNLATAIGTIPTETPLPTLTNPAAAGDILLHKEAIDGQGAKLTGTLDPLEDAELDSNSPPEIVSGELEIELVHGQDFVKELTYSVPDALPENIVSGKEILGVIGTARTGGTESDHHVIRFIPTVSSSDYTVQHSLGVVPTVAAVIALDTSVPNDGASKVVSGQTSFGEKVARMIGYKTDGTLNYINGGFSFLSATETSVTFRSAYSFHAQTEYIIIFA